MFFNSAIKRNTLFKLNLFYFKKNKFNLNNVLHVNIYISFYEC